ncbi:MAG: PAS domain-containing protein [Planctomycetota bacterium]
MLRHKRILIAIRLLFLILIAALAIPSFVQGALSPVLPTLLAAYLVTNLAMLAERGDRLTSQRVQAFMVLFDISVLGIALASLEQHRQELFLAMFLVVLLASAGQRLSVSVGGFVAVAAFYVGLAGHDLGAEGGPSATLLTGLPVLFVVAIYVGYVSETVARERRRRLEAEDRLRQELQGMRRLQSLATSPALEPDAERILSAAAEAARCLLGSPQAAVLWIRPGDASFRIASAPGLDPERARRWSGTPPEISPVREALEKDQVLRLAPPAYSPWREPELSEILLAPFTDRVGNLRGALVAAWAEPHEHFKVEEEAAAALVEHARICLENAALFRLLSQTRDVWQATFQSVPAPVVILDGTRRILQANPAFLALTGQDIADLVGRSFADVLEGACHADGTPWREEEVSGGRTVRLTIPRLNGRFDITRGPYLGLAGDGPGTVWVLRPLPADVTAH